MNEDEDPARCAIREVNEETGFDISPYLNPDEYLESVLNDQLVRLYVIKNVPKSTEFKPKTRCEIKACSWFAVSDLPNHKKDATPKVKIGVSSNSFFMVFPFIKRVKQICNGQSTSKKYRQKSTSFSESESSKSKVKGKIQEEEKNMKKRERRHSKRQLFADEDNRPVEFVAPSWLNFKFDRMAIMDCLR